MGGASVACGLPAGDALLGGARMYRTLPAGGAPQHGRQCALRLARKPPLFFIFVNFFIIFAVI
jgi:hypothetical protein